MSVTGVEVALYGLLSIAVFFVVTLLLFSLDNPLRYISHCCRHLLNPQRWCRRVDQNPAIERRRSSTFGQIILISRQSRTQQYLRRFQNKSSPTHQLHFSDIKSRDCRMYFILSNIIRKVRSYEYKSDQVQLFCKFFPQHFQQKAMQRKEPGSTYVDIKGNIFLNPTDLCCVPCSDEEEGNQNKIDLGSSEPMKNQEERPHCTICLDEYKDKDTVVWSNNDLCNHHYHIRCIVEWLLDNEGKCPMCREEFILIEGLHYDPADFNWNDDEGSFQPQ